ncbi:YfhO family protein [Flavisolibacter ginsenosidimutans]|uniref:YfhO family protein n=1 Tax=Flavisolibacter ginsenosidimutans TaxID=661481 RepID=A0A5B8UFC3_9BACT|nr:YfhO family protein [Flavisolibacter ginsenosidimutans]QEC55075.1 YfhO family protein [Flavisolibacter ginsenosidimutans]
MKKGPFAKILPHFIALVVFLLVSILYCQPALEGKVVNQSDVTHWKGAIHQSQVYAETHGQYPLWTNALFSGMPAFQIGMPGNNLLPWYAHAVLTLSLPKPIQFFFLACICFYFLCCVLRINPYIGIFGALAYGYATYNAVILSVGHETKMWSIAYMAALLGAILLVYERRKYWIGAALTGLIASVMIAVNHPQIDYYFFLIAAVLTVVYIIRWVQAKDYTHLAKALGFVGVAAVIGLLINSVNFFSTLEYQKQTIRGGAGELAEKHEGDAAKGLTKDYAFDYSLYPSEPIVMMVPRAFGGSSSKPEVSQDDSKAVQAAATVPEQLRNQLPLSYYWGGLVSPTSVGTSGPPYIGAVICFLAIIGFFLVDGRYKWWILAACILAILMSWGKYFIGFNTLLYHYLPLYNKFRAPSMILVIPQLLLPLMAVLTVDKVLCEKDKQAFVSYFKKGLIAVGVVFVLLLLCYMSFDFKNTNDKEILRQVASSGQPQLTESVRGFFDGLVADRKSMMLSDIFRALGFCLLGAGALYLAVRKMVKPVVLGLILSAVVLVDLLPVDSRYLSKEDYQEETDNDAGFVPNDKDKSILADKSYFRVFNLLNPFNENFTAYHFNAVGGYHPAKLRIYQELIEKELSQEANLLGTTLQSNPAGLDSLHMPALNMLNAKYIIAKDPNSGQTQFATQNKAAMGPAWLVRSLKVVKDAREEMAAFATLNPRDTAVMQQSFSNKISGPTAWTGEGTITLDKNDNDVANYSFNSNSNQFAVFSEVYYDAGWKAFIDGKEAPIVKVNYVLRGLLVPAGAHKIEFCFEPQDYLLGRKLTTIFTIALLLLIAAAIFFEWRAWKQIKPVTANS